MAENNGVAAQEEKKEKLQYVLNIVEGKVEPPHESMTLNYFVERAREVMKEGEVLSKSCKQTQATLEQQKQNLVKLSGLIGGYMEDILKWLDKAEDDNAVKISKDEGRKSVDNA